MAGFGEDSLADAFGSMPAVASKGQGLQLGGAKERTVSHPLLQAVSLNLLEMSHSTFALFIPQPTLARPEASGLSANFARIPPSS